MFKNSEKTLKGLGEFIFIFGMIISIIVGLVLGENIILKIIGIAIGLLFSYFLGLILFTLGQLSENIKYIMDKLENTTAKNGPYRVCEKCGFETKHMLKSCPNCGTVLKIPAVKTK